MENTFSTLKSYIPAVPEMPGMLKFIVIFAFLSIFLGLLGRVIFGVRSDMNHAISSVMGIFFIYLIVVVVYTFDVPFVKDYLFPLPFISFADDTLFLFSFQNATFTVICAHVLSMLLLAFMVSILDLLVPKGSKMLVWYLLRTLSIILSIVLYTVASQLIDKHLPEIFIQYAPIVLVAIIGVMLLLAVTKVIFATVLTISNPIIGALYTFFFSNIVGKQLSKAALATIIFSVLLLILEHFGFAAISITTAALITYIPLILALLVLWYLIGHVL